MSVLHLESFDGYDTLNDFAGRLTIAGTGGSINASGRNGQCYRAGASGTVTRPFTGATSKRFTAGYAFKLDSYPAGERVISRWLHVNSAGQDVYIRLDATGALDIAPQNYSTSPKTTLLIALNTWYYIEHSVIANLNQTSGRSILRVNGIIVLDYSFTGGSVFDGAWSGYQLGGTSSTGWGSVVRSYDDFYLLDDAGGRPLNDFLGDTIVYCLRPNGNGDASDFLGSDADSVDNYQMVDEANIGDGDYVEGSTEGDQDSYLYPNLSDASPPYSVAAVQVNTRGAWTGGQQDLAARALLSGIDDVKFASLSNTLSEVRNVFPEKPSGGGWSISDFNSTEFGWEVPHPAPYFIGVNTASISSATTILVAKPAGVVEDDLLIAMLYRHSTYQTITPPAGWTQLFTQDNSNNINLVVYYKVAGASEPADYTWTFGAAQSNARVILSAWGLVDTADPIEGYEILTGTTSGAGSGLLASPAFTVVGTSPTLIRLAAWAQGQVPILVPNRATLVSSGPNSSNPVGVLAYERGVTVAPADNWAQAQGSVPWISVSLLLNALP